MPNTSEIQSLDQSQFMRQNDLDVNKLLSRITSRNTLALTVRSYSTSTVLPNDTGIAVNTGGGNTFTLPATHTWGNDLASLKSPFLTIINASSTASLSIVPTGSDVIDHGTGVVLPPNTGMQFVVYNGGGWITLNSILGTNEISVHAFGAVGDYNPTTGVGTDDSAAFQGALNYAAEMGGTVSIRPDRIYRIDSSITVPSGVTLKGPWKTGTSGFTTAPTNTNPATLPFLPFQSQGGSLWITFDAGRGDGTATYNVTDARGLPNFATRTGAINLRGSLSGVNVFQWAFGNAKSSAYTDSANWNSAWNSGFMSGLAIRQDGEDALVENCFIGGFMQAILAYNLPRLRVREVKMDCMNGIEVSSSGDTIMLHEVHQWPFAAEGYSLSSNVRRGSFIYLHDSVDWPKLSNCFTYASKNGYVLENIGNAQLVNCTADNQNVETAGYYGLLMNAVQNSQVQNFMCSNRQFGIYTATSTTLAFSGVEEVSVDEGYHIVSGNVIIIGGRILGQSAATSIGINNLGTGRVEYEGMAFATVLKNTQGNVFQFGPGLTQSVTTTYQITPADTFIYANASGGSYTVTLPPVASWSGQSREIIIKRGDGSANTLTIAKNPVDIAGSIVLLNDTFVVTTTMPGHSAARFITDGATNWLQIQ